MFSRAGRTLTQIGGRHALGMNLRGSQLRSERRPFLGIRGSAWNWENLPARIEKDEPCSYREEREEELACDREDEGEEQ
jgi:hypothetical protein